MQLFIDDVRAPWDIYLLTGAEWTVARDAKEALEYIAAGNVTTISFDNDLGLFSKEGWEIMRTMVNWIMDGLVPCPKQILIHSANPVAVARMNHYINDLRRLGYYNG